MEDGGKFSERNRVCSTEGARVDERWCERAPRGWPGNGVVPQMKIKVFYDVLYV